ncbi:hydroxylamine reductase [Desulfovibrio sp.]|uniref:hydroxylamine reductase n=1 Tax=Desulfovibrio sp. TaxID=885 RepID=UPI0023D1FA8E|nr:hydroxylamine reductase [Desulfovibrio sp.]MDE7240973.1 hydroxylamine reductase [Desulfovibrio sp.]
MFCDQCEQTAKGVGCTVAGVCGKTADVALLQDQLTYLLRRLAPLVEQAREKGMNTDVYDDFIADTLFATLTNVNFDAKAIEALQTETLLHARTLAAQLGEVPEDLSLSIEEYRKQLPESVVGMDNFSSDADVNSAMQILLFGLKGLCAYKDHAARLGQRDKELSSFVCKALIAGSPWDGAVRDLGGWLDLVLECGRGNLKAMELLDAGNTGHFGDPVPTPVDLGHRKGKAILISGHDLYDLEALLKQTEGTGINVYTHCEMLPAHGYPRLKAYPHLAGHFGTAWQNQQKELPDFPGPVLFTTNCIQNPRAYGDKVFTSGNVSWPGCTHCRERDFSAVIEKAKAMPGYAEDAPGQKILTGFGRKTMLAAAPAVLDAVAQGKLRHIFLVGGCDGAKPARNYYTEFVEKTPQDTVVLTLACGKFRFYNKDLGKLGDLPRLMDCGQCNDAYTAIQTALALADALKCDVNDLPLSMVLSWYEQKAVAILLTLLALGVRNIVIGPSLPAFVSPAILNILVEQWGLRLMTTPDEDMARLLGKK